METMDEKTRQQALESAIKIGLTPLVESILDDVTLDHYKHHLKHGRITCYNMSSTNTHILTDEPQPLVFAIAYKHDDIAKFLIWKLETVVKPVREKNFKTLLTDALYMALHLENLKVVEMLLKAGAYTESNDYFGALNQVFFDDLAIPVPGRSEPYFLAFDLKRKIMQMGLSPSDVDKMKTGSNKFKLECVKLLLAAGADVNFGPCVRRALIWPCRYGDAEIIRVLLKAGAIPSMEVGDTYRKRKEDVVTTSEIEAVMAFNSTEKATKCLHVLIEELSYDFEICCKFRGRGYHKAPMIYAAIKNLRPELLKIFLEQGADIPRLEKPKPAWLDELTKAMGSLDTSSASSNIEDIVTDPPAPTPLATALEGMYDILEYQKVLPLLQDLQNTPVQRKLMEVVQDCKSVLKILLNEGGQDVNEKMHFAYVIDDDKTEMVEMTPVEYVARAHKVPLIDPKILFEAGASEEQFKEASRSREKFLEKLKKK